MKLFLTGAGLILTIVLGMIMNRTGKPYPTVLFTFHKLIALAGFILLLILVINSIRAAGADTLLIILLIATGLAFTGILLSGAFISLDKQFRIMQVLHRVCTVVYFFGSGGLLWKIFA